MVTEKVKEIKNAEEKADAIIKNAEEKADAIAGSLDMKTDSFEKAEEKNFLEELQRYRAAGDAKTEGRINELKEEYSRRLSVLNKEAAKKIALSAESVWESIKNSIMP